MDTLREWKAAKAHLTEALQHYLQACIKLESALSYSISDLLESANSTSCSSLENSVLEVYAESPSMEAIESKTSEAHAYVKKLLNRSTKLVPISVLPAEILARIFSLTMICSRCSLDYSSRPDMMLVIPSVCGWRR